MTIYIPDQNEKLFGLLRSKTSGTTSKYSLCESRTNEPLTCLILDLFKGIMHDLHVEGGEKLFWRTMAHSVEFAHFSVSEIN